MIPDNLKDPIAQALSDLGGTDEQIEQIGNIVFAVSALDRARDTEYLLDVIREQTDPLVKQACRIILNALLGYPPPSRNGEAKPIPIQTGPKTTNAEFVVKINGTEPPPDWAEKTERKLRKELELVFGPNVEVIPVVS